MEHKPAKINNSNHLAAACAALALAAVLIGAGVGYARWLEARYIHAIATGVTDQMTI